MEKCKIHNKFGFITCTHCTGEAERKTKKEAQKELLEELASTEEEIEIFTLRKLKELNIKS